jgi:hypothetical protein
VTDLLQQSDIREAQERANRIRLGIVSYLATLSDICSAWDRRDWQTLGYADWDSYLDGEFSETRLRVPAEHRAKAITELRMAGMSTRAIAATVNLSQSAVTRDVRQLSQKTQLEQPQTVRGLDGRERPAAQPNKPAPAPAPRAAPDSPPDTQGAAEDREDPQPILSVQDPAAATQSDASDQRLPIPVSPVRAASGPARESVIPNEEDLVRRSEMVGKALASVYMALDPDPVFWATALWRPAAFRQRDLPRVRDAFTAEGLRTLGDHLHNLADHLDRNGETL